MNASHKAVTSSLPMRCEACFFTNNQVLPIGIHKLQVPRVACLAGARFTSAAYVKPGKFKTFPAAAELSRRLCSRCRPPLVGRQPQTQPQAKDASLELRNQQPHQPLVARAENHPSAPAHRRQPCVRPASSPAPPTLCWWRAFASVSARIPARSSCASSRTARPVSRSVSRRASV